MSSAGDYWSVRYTDPEGIKHHRNQNLTITRDFVRACQFRKPFTDALAQRSIIEVGCGTGEMAAYLKRLYNTRIYYATDMSRDAVKTAQERFPQVNFWVYDVLRDPPPIYCFLCLSSNTLEHFTNPSEVIEKMFELGKQLLLLVPYAQPTTDDFDHEGGAGHVSTFTEETFADYNVVDMFTFETKGWAHSSAGEKPMQFAVLINAD